MENEPDLDAADKPDLDLSDAEALADVVDAAESLAGPEATDTSTEEVCVPDPRCGPGGGWTFCVANCATEGDVQGVKTCCLDGTHTCWAVYHFEPCTAGASCQDGSCYVVGDQ